MTESINWTLAVFYSILLWTLSEFSLLNALLPFSSLAEWDLQQIYSIEQCSTENSSTMNSLQHKAGFYTLRILGRIFVYLAFCVINS